MEPTPSKNTIVTQSLTIGYPSKKGHKKIATAIDLELQSGELVGLIGPNGVGKSTLIRTLCQIQAGLSGTIMIKNIPLDQYTPIALATQLSLVLTDPIATKNLSVQELVALGRHPYTNWMGRLTTLDKEKIVEALRLTHCLDLAQNKCFELSDGQLQKVLIARAIAQDTSIVVLDEPTTHLDSYHKAHVLQLLQKLAHETQKTVLFSTHEINLALQLCDKMILMTKSHTYFGSAKELIANGNLNTLFPKGLIEFDTDCRGFRMKNRP